MQPTFIKDVNFHLIPGFGHCCLFCLCTV